LPNDLFFSAFLCDLCGFGGKSLFQESALRGRIALPVKETRLREARDKGDEAAASSFSYPITNHK
jgi:hypothetical protein